ncbi:MAG: hypothetical protein JWM96_1051 [Alphaproteobacteria bacterium]|nr:hypothetical protein [Alphaproteobacteria bacterium]
MLCNHMTQKFDPKKDFILPDAEFAQRLLGQGRMKDFCENESSLALQDVALEDVTQQVKISLSILAINNKWPGYDKVVPINIEEKDPDELKMAKLVLNKMHQGYLSKVINNEVPSNEDHYGLAYSRPAGFMALKDATTVLSKLGYKEAIEPLQQYMATEVGIETDYDYFEAVEKYLTYRHKNNFTPGSEL